jgi:cytochrome c oxidase assembly factor CtaG
MVHLGMVMVLAKVMLAAILMVLGYPYLVATEKLTDLRLAKLKDHRLVKLTGLRLAK